MKEDTTCPPEVLHGIRLGSPTVLAGGATPFSLKSCEENRVPYCEYIELLILRVHVWQSDHCEFGRTPVLDSRV